MNGNTNTCKNCDNQFSGAYCNRCGEKIYSPHDKKVKHIIEEGFHFLTHFEGTFFTTLKTMFTKPGQLSTDYCNGVRKKYFKPLSLFLILIIFYLLFPILEGLNMKLQYYPKADYYGNFAQAKIDKTLTQTGMSIQTLSEKFHAKGEKTSKFLLITIIPFTALVFYVIAFFKRRYFFDHMVFSSEINSFYLLWGFLLLPLLMLTISYFSKLITGKILPFSDFAIGIMIYAVMCFYLARAVKRFYQLKWWQTLLFLVVFYFSHTFIVYTLYKFLLFVTVINQIH
jgi:Protein of unknown function (DUF3667)